MNTKIFHTSMKRWYNFYWRISMNLKKKNINHPTADIYELSFKAEDGSMQFADVLLPKGDFTHIMLEFPDYKNPPKDLLNLGRYTSINMGVVSVHVRGQIGKSENKLATNFYIPLLTSHHAENLYYNHVYSDVVKWVKLVKSLFPDKTLFAFGNGQGATFSVIAGSTHLVERLYICNILLSDLQSIYEKNLDTGFYGCIREYARYNEENIMLNLLDSIDILPYAQKLNCEVLYGISGLDVVSPVVTQRKFIENVDKIKVIEYRKFEHEVLQQHFFDEFVLEHIALNK